MKYVDPMMILANERHEERLREARAHRQFKELQGLSGERGQVWKSLARSALGGTILAALIAVIVL